MPDVLEIQFAGLADGEFAVVCEEFVPAGEYAAHGEGEGGTDAGCPAEKRLPAADRLVFEDRKQDGDGLLGEGSGRQGLKLKLGLGEIPVDLVQNLLEVLSLPEQVEGSKGTVGHFHHWSFRLHALAQALAQPAH